MPWENRDPVNKEMESLRNELSLENIMTANILSEEPTVEDIKEGQMRMVGLDGSLYLYTRCGDTIYRKEWDAV